MGILLLILASAAACSGGPRDLEPPADGDVSQDVDIDAWSDADIDIGDPESVPNCGDGVLDPGEECDDNNRLNGDGCDWVCRIGDGPPTPDPDPDTPHYEPFIPEVSYEDSPRDFWLGLGIGLEWNGAGLAAALYEPTEHLRPEEADTHIWFFEATYDGVIGGNDWNYPVPSAYGTEGEGIKLDLVWTGDGYGLFYTAPVDGPWLGFVDLWFLSLDETGKPVGDPVFLNTASMVSAIDAETFDGGFVVAWAAWNERWSDCRRGHGAALATLTVQLVAHDGTSDDLPGPMVVSDDVVHEASIAAGDGGFGITFIEGIADSCTARFVRVNADLSEVNTSGTLANSVATDVELDGEEYVVAIAHGASSERGFPAELCVARYTSTGLLSGPPVCNGPFSEHDLDLHQPTSVGLAVGDGGLAAMLMTTLFIVEGGEEAYPRLFFFRTDLSGRQVASPVRIDRSGRIHDASIAWTGDGFTSLHARSDHHGTETYTLVFNRFTRE